MSTESPQARSRRAVLIGAAGAAAALAAEAIARPLPAAATASPLMTETSNVANGPTTLTSSQATVSASAAMKVQASSATSLVHGVWGQATHPQASGVIGSSYSPTGRGVSGMSTSGVGVAGTSESGSGVAGEATESYGIGVRATGAGAAVALKAIGKVVLSRSGRSTVSAGHSSVDVDLRTKGGLGGTPLCFANLATYRSGVSVAAVRPNYPIAGKLRVYLKRAVTSSTYVAWLVLN